MNSSPSSRISHSSPLFHRRLALLYCIHNCYVHLFRAFSLSCVDLFGACQDVHDPPPTSPVYLTPGDNNGSSKNNSNTDNNGNKCSHHREPSAAYTSAMTGKTPTTPARGKADGGRGARDAVDYEVAQKALDVIRHRVKHYRMYLKPSFQVRSRCMTRRCRHWCHERRKLREY